MNTAEQYVMSLLESITDGLVILDRGWCYTYLNAQAERLLGRTRQDLLSISAGLRAKWALVCLPLHRVSEWQWAMGSGTMKPALIEKAENRGRRRA